MNDPRAPVADPLRTGALLPTSTAPLDPEINTCPHAPGGNGCICGFKDTVPEAEWSGYQIDCDFFDNACVRQCCAPGREPSFADPTTCEDTFDEPTKDWFGPYPDHADPADRMQLAWSVFGSDTCTVTGTVGGHAFSRTDGPVGTVFLGDFDPRPDVDALQATLRCENGFGLLESRYSIAPSSQRVKLTPVDTHTRACWQVLPFFLAGREPYQGNCHLEVCPPGVELDRTSLFPCFSPSFTAPVPRTIGCADIPAVLASGTTVSVTCESGDIQDERDFTTVP